IGSPGNNLKAGEKAAADVQPVAPGLEVAGNISNRSWRQGRLGGNGFIVFEDPIVIRVVVKSQADVDVPARRVGRQSVERGRYRSGEGHIEEIHVVGVANMI